jgi:polar amino acid transport system ATP-binding protein
MPKDGDEVPASEAHLRRIRRRVGMVFQQFNLFPHMSALRNVAEAPRRVSGLERGAAEERARRLLARVGLEHKADAYPAQLSGGQQQRVAIARALAMEPELLLFDEVTSGLDPELVGEVLDVLRELADHGAEAEKGRTMLIVTHQVHFAREIADRVVFLDGGRILEEGTPEKIFTSPESPRTLAFLKSVLEA